MKTPPEPNTPADPVADLPLFRFASTVIPTTRPDGAVLVIPGKPVALEEEVPVETAVNLIGKRYSRRTLQRHFRGRNRARGCKLSIPVRELEKLKARK